MCKEWAYVVRIDFYFIIDDGFVAKRPWGESPSVVLIGTVHNSVTGCRAMWLWNHVVLEMSQSTIYESQLPKSGIDRNRILTGRN